MGNQYSDGTIARRAAAAAPAYALVKIDANGKWEAAGSTDGDVVVGSMLREAFNADDIIEVAPVNKTGSFRAIADGAITEGAAAYLGAGGKVSGAGTDVIGVALETTTADGDEIEVMPR